MKPSYALPSGTGIHIWQATTQQMQSWLAAENLRPYLPPEEINKFKAFLAPLAAAEFALGRLMLRNTLSSYHPQISPIEWRFEFNYYGKPAVANLPREDKLDFSLSHSGGGVVLAFCIGANIGIDIEHPRSNIDLLSLAQSSFSPEEAATLEGKSETSLAEAFYCYWTLKEAYIKARGMGLSLPLDQFTFHVPTTKLAPISIKFGTGIQDEPALWWFHQMQFNKSPLSLAVKRAGQVESLTLHEFTLAAPPIRKAA